MKNSTRGSNEPDGARFLTVKQLAIRLQISERQVHRFGRSVRIAIEDIEFFEFRNRSHREPARDTA